VNVPVRQETSRDRRRRETRGALLDAAYACFCELGYAKASLDAIAARAGFTKGALYAHFASKDELFLTVAEERSAELEAGLREIDATGDVPAQLAAWLVTTMRQHRDWFLANAEFALASARDPQLAARRHAEHAALVARIGQLAGGPGELITALIDGLVIQAAVDPELDLAGAVADGVARLSGGRE
jgi:AcrR family transcriptional regulator